MKSQDDNLTQQQKNKQFIQEAIEQFFNRHDLTAPDRIYDPGFVQHNAKVAAMTAAQGMTNLEGVKSFFSMLFTAFPDYRVEIEHIMAEEDQVFLVCNWFGTHRGEFMGVPATGKQIRVRTAEVLTIANGKIVAHWDVEDQTEMMIQLGLLNETQPQVGKER